MTLSPLKVVREVLRPFDRMIFRFWLRRLNGNAFCILFNVRSFLSGKIKKVKLRYDSESKIFHATSRDMDVAMFSPVQILGMYGKGVQHRIEHLAMTYFLPDIDFRKGDVVVDCGANIGELAVYFMSKKMPIEYIGIEPAHREFQCLKKNADGYTTHNIGLWKEEDSHLEFFVSSDGADSSFITPSSQIDDVIKIPARKLECLLPDRKIRLLKVEAEGAEPEVLMGCEGILDNIEYISVDAGPERGLKQEMTVIPVVNHLVSRGFEWLKFRQKNRGDRAMCLFRRNSDGLAAERV